MCGVVMLKQKCIIHILRNWISKTVSCYFIGYLERSKSFRFYCPSHTTRIVETRHAVFFENYNISRSNEKMNCKPTRKRSNLCSNFDLYRGYTFFSFREK
jgi:hypothetical protein